jgi:hypothetical protein
MEWSVLSNTYNNCDQRFLLARRTLLWLDRNTSKENATRGFL